MRSSAEGAYGRRWGGGAQDVGRGLLRIDYALNRLLWQDPDRDQLDVWGASLQMGDLTIESNEETRWNSIAWAVLYAMDVDRWISLGHRPFDVADADSADAAYYYEHVFDGRGELLEDVVEAFE